MAWVDVTVDVKDDQHPAMFNSKEMMLNLSGAVDLSTVSTITIGKVKYNILYTVDIAERGETTDVKLEEFKSKK